MSLLTRIILVSYDESLQPIGFDSIDSVVSVASHAFLQVSSCLLLLYTTLLQLESEFFRLDRGHGAFFRKV